MYKILDTQVKRYCLNVPQRHSAVALEEAVATVAVQSHCLSHHPSLELAPRRSAGRSVFRPCSNLPLQANPWDVSSASPGSCCQRTCMGAPWWPATLSMTQPTISSRASTASRRTTACSATWRWSTPRITQPWGWASRTAPMPCRRLSKTASPTGPTGTMFLVRWSPLALFISCMCCDTQPEHVSACSKVVAVVRSGNSAG